MNKDAIDICVVINSKYTVFMSEESIANYKIDMKESEKENLKLLFYFSHLFPRVSDSTFTSFPLGRRNEGPRKLISFTYSLMPQHSLSKTISFAQY